MEPTINNLSKEQLAILNLTEGKHLILSAPGTGKTELIAQRVLKAAEQDNFPLDEIVCLTFTNRAARNMLDRVQLRAPKAKVTITNFHGFGTLFLTKNQIIPQAASFIDEEDAEELYKEACDLINASPIRYNNFSKIAQGLKILSLELNNYIKNYSYVNIPKDLLAHFIAYERLKKESLLYDYDDILLLTLKHLIESKPEYTFGKFSFIQVDETQDLNEIQWNIVKYIQKPNANVVLFGDIYQSIFGFLGASLNLFLEFTKDYQRHTLTTNFRSETEIIDMLNCYLGWYFTEKKYTLPFQNFNSKAINSEHLKLINFNTDSQHSQYQKIYNYVKRLSKNNRQTAFLFYRNIDVEMFYDLWDFEIGSVFKVSKFDLFRRGFVKDIFAFLNSIHRNFERINWVRLLKLFGGFKTLKSARQFINEMSANGILPIDLTNEDLEYSAYLSNFNNLFNNGRLIFFDTETSGLNTGEDDIIQIAAVEIINGKIKSKFNVYMKTDKDLSETSKIHHITNSFLEANGVSIKEGLLQFNDFVKGSPLVAHNLSFDKNMLINNIKRHGLTSKFTLPTDMFDTIEIIRRVLPKLHSYKLSYLVELLDINAKNTHNAIDDVEATVEVLQKLKDNLEKTVNDAELFIIDNMLKLKRFTVNFAPYYNKVINNKEEVSFRKLIEDFVSFAKIEDPNIAELSKLLNHMDLKTKPDKVLSLLNKYMPFYRKCKISDLITENDKYIITTIHKAKGLEFDTVIIPDFCIQNFPDKGIYSDEKQKLLYVAMSRAKTNLIITSGNSFDGAPTVMSPLLEPVKHLFSNKL